MRINASFGTKPTVRCRKGFMSSARARDRGCRDIAARALALGILGLGPLSLGCSAYRPAPTTPAAAVNRIDPREPHQSASIRRPFELSTGEDYVVRIVAPGTSCSGTLIAEQIVLTAHHCVALRNGAGKILPADLAPERLTVELGSGHFPWAEVPVRAIVAPTCGFAAGQGDIALLILERKLHGALTLAPALDVEPTRNADIAHLGFGRCALSEDGIYLKRRLASRIDLVGKTYFRALAPLCPGDSGGPVVDQRSGALIGVVSAGAMDGDEQTPDRIEFARLDPFRSLFSNVERVLQGIPMSELPPVDCPAPEALPARPPSK